MWISGNELVSWTKSGALRSFLVRKAGRVHEEVPGVRPASPAGALPAAAPATKIPPRSVFGIGSWPRPKWLVRALHERLEGRMDE